MAGLLALIQLSALRSGVLRVSAAELERELEWTNGEIAAVLRRLREEARHAAGQESPLRRAESWMSASDVATRTA